MLSSTRLIGRGVLQGTSKVLVVPRYPSQSVVICYRSYSEVAVPTHSTIKHRNLGFEPSLLKKPNKHDHPERPSSVLIAQVPPVVVEERIAVCDGGFLGHPRVFINLDPSSPDDPVHCDYCGLRFIRKSHIPPGHPLLQNQE
eukprot:TRINITY_DN2170_c0_g2_i1.p1 TRINITY_DN2170_c0_g2~~TRINITY_DN2170_c0_g2_i1.p1  ORF type:complete len:142 (+),score=24.11 TRINITY_DN2170_c0_g2_i1:15-440(+)